MSFLSDLRKTQPLESEHNECAIRSLSNTNNMVVEVVTPTTTPGRQTRQLSMHSNTTKPRVVIPATVKRQRMLIVAEKEPHRRGPLTLFGVLVGGMVVFILATLLVVPLDGEQHPQSLAQTVNNWISSGQPGVMSFSQHIDAPPPTPALLTGEGYCGGADIWGTCATYVTESGMMGTGQMQHPLAKAVITQIFANPEYQEWCGCWKPHTGIDLAAPYGTPVMAADSGQVIWTGWDWSGLGWAVKINHGHYIATIYGHLQRFIVSVGQNVIKGQVIAYEGSTGASTGPHVHFMVLYNNIWVNPMNYMQLP